MSSATVVGTARVPRTLGDIEAWWHRAEVIAWRVVHGHPSRFRPDGPVGCGCGQPDKQQCPYFAWAVRVMKAAHQRKQFAAVPPDREHNPPGVVPFVDFDYPRVVLVSTVAAAHGASASSGAPDAVPWWWPSTGSLVAAVPELSR